MTKGKIFIAVNHKLTDEQLKEIEGYELVYPSEELKPRLLQCTDDESAMCELSHRLVEEILKSGIGQNRTLVLGPTGSPYFWHLVCQRLGRIDVKFLYAHSVRESAEVTGPDGSVTKVNVFKHVRFIWV